MTKDDNKGITSIAYNHLNLPTSIATGSGTISYVYDAAGTKLEKEVSVGSSVTVYAGNFIYLGNATTQTLQFFSTPEGYVTPDGMGGYDYVYQYKDHLGNVRLSYSDGNGDGDIDVTADPMTTEIIEENNYYPFGLKHKGYNEGTSALGNDVAQKLKFGGKELSEELGLETYDFGARNYDPALGRWMNIDPLAEVMRRHSPYNYAFDNPVYFEDPDGMMPIGPGKGILKATKSLKRQGRCGSQARLRSLLSDNNVSKADKGWIRQEINQIKRGKRTSIRNPKGKVLAHERGREAAKGYSYEHSKLNDKMLHDIQHKFDDNGKKNKERPIAEAIVAFSESTGISLEVNSDNTNTGSKNADTVSEGMSLGESISSVAAEGTGNETIDGVFQFSLGTIETIDNFGKKIFGNNALGNAVDDLLNPSPGLSEIWLDSKKRKENGNNTNDANQPK
ncbi:polymorphic toxin type 8 domain-containing protein [Muricauda sp. SK9]|uniref:RHS repeat-associated core domain-containing protein n=1 Tax=Flavobacteriaceae TaxID=49546 RepID=UPI001FE27156|nr:MULTISPECIES: RHS repeat-associated core domain-containing protein [Allomuricauda]MDC6384634.1 polymorphic toxin type 8 domain-containing protein [Muricauda sp. SK9]